ncbi:MAG TPA: hypothetical protein VEZ48_00255 [Sphingomonadaceae bacterium]|nr:hypothetical protein [Sphingomonadaceae bacterium]
MQRLQRSYRLKIYEGGSHALVENGLDMRRELGRWFDAYVRDKTAGSMNGVAALHLRIEPQAKQAPADIVRNLESAKLCS